MPLETNFNTTPYWDDFNEDKDFYKILFKPGVALQTRELNQLQTILQKQVERFGDHVFKSGTIVSGVNFIYNPLLAYAKIRDLQEDGQPANPQDYVGLFVKNSANLQAIVVNYASGFESKSPDLNTLFLQYTNSGNTFNLNAFSNDDVLEVFSKENNLFDVDVNNGGLGFANSDSLHVISALTVQISSGAFTNGEIFTQATTGARQQIVGIQNGSTANTKILSIKPLNSEQLANTSANSASWTISTGYNITGNTSSAVATVVSQIGSGATGSIITDSLGVVQNIVLSNGGKDYTTLPQVVIKPASGSASVSTLDLAARTYKTKVRVAPGTFADPVGYGYSFGVTEGVIYQKGTFSRVLPQSIIVSKYSTAPDNLSVGFTSDEYIVKYTTDSSLYDNAANTYNETAPGADRLRIRPTLYVVNTDIGAANSQFLSLVEFSEGKASKENRNTIYNELSKEFETRTFESAGNFVINSFKSTTKEKTANTTHVSVVVDPGLAYISGKRVETKGNITKDVQKSNTVFTKANQTITANFGNYVKVKELAGFFDFKTGGTVKLYDTAKSYLTNVTVGSTATITPAGNQIGTASMRSIVYQEGTIGTPNALYRMYLFDINMNAGKSFRDVKSFYFDGSYDGVCDAVLETDGTSGASIAVLYDTNNPDIIFPTGAKAVKSIYDISYTYRTSTENLTLGTDGTIQITAPTTYTFPYSGSLSLSAAQKADFVIAPVSNTTTSNTTGTVSGNTTSANLVGTSTSFLTDYAAGDYISVYTTPTAYDVKRVQNVVNNTLIILNSALTAANSSMNTALFFPAYYPLDLSRADRTITTSANAAVATVALNKTVASANVVAFYNIRIPSATQINKDLDRDLYVKIYTGNNVTVSASGNNTTGPWSLGIPDTFRLKNVYYGNTASSTDVTKHFYVNAYNDGDTVKNAELRLVPGSNLAISNTQWLLAKFDAFDVNASEGFITINSYNDLIDDTTGFSNNTFINRLEVPEVLTSDSRYYDGIDCIDFRPFTTNTAVYSTTIAGATVNPANTQTLSADEKYFPVPDSAITFDIDFYGSRIDRVVVNKDSNISVLQGAPDVVNLKEPGAPSDSITINRLFVPPYPSLPIAVSNTTFQILDKKIGNENAIVNGRQQAYTINNLNSSADTRAQPKRYSMSQISKLEKRIDTLEKQVALNTLEKQITQLVIPSSNDAGKDRFKNAFLVDGFDDAFIADRSSVENTAYIDSQNSELLPLTTIFNIESIFDRSDAATSSNIHQDKTLLLPYEEFTFISQLSASEPAVPRVTPSQPNVDVTYYPVENEVYVPPTITPIVDNGPTVVPTPPVPPPIKPTPAMVRVVIDGSVTYYEADFVSDYYYNHKDELDSLYGIEFSGFRAGDTTAVFDVTLTSKCAIPEVQVTCAEPIVTTCTIDPPETEQGLPRDQITDANWDDAIMDHDGYGGSKYVEDFSYQVY